MTIINPGDSIARANSIDHWRASGLCLDFVDWAMGRPVSRLGDNGGPPNGAWTEAKDGYYFSAHQHPGDMNPPPGVPCYWETGPSGNTAGHIVISLGDGWCRTTDYAGAASVSTASIEWLTEARAGGYLGWTEDYGGNPIDGIGAQLAAETITPKPRTYELENQMSIPILYADTERVGILAVLEGDRWRDIPCTEAGAEMVNVFTKTNQTFFPEKDATVYVSGKEFICVRSLHVDGDPDEVFVTPTPEFIESVKALLPGLPS